MVVGPLKLAAGVKFSVPSGLMLTVPLGLLAAVTVSWSPSMSLSLLSTLMLFRAVSSLVLQGPSFTGSGLSFVAGMFTVTVAVELPPWPSLMVYWKLAAPLKLAAGVKVTLPSGLRTAVPLVEGPMLAMLRASASTSVSLPKRVAAVIVTGVSSVVLWLSLVATGASLTALTVKLMVLGVW